jgi:molybdenum cofactor cytidylyltransferase
MTPESVAGVLLAAGTSSRMGTNKLFVELGGTTVLRRAALTAGAAGLDPILVVLGHESSRAQAELAGLSCSSIFNPEYARGMNTSLRAGISALPESAPAAVVLLADMPFVTPEMIRQLVGQWRRGNVPLVVSVYEDVVAPPILYPRRLFPELRALDGDGCGKAVVKRHRGEALEVSWPASALTDLDLPADIERVRTALEGR